MRLRLFVCVVCCVLGVSNANAIMCDIEDVPIDSVVTNFGSSSCGGTRKNLVVAKFTGHTNDINICSFYNQARDYRNDGVLIFPPDRYQEPLQVSTSACKSRGYLRHLSKLSGIGHTCGDRYNLEDLQAYGVIVTEKEDAPSSCSPTATITTLKKIDSSGSQETTCYFGKTYVPNGWVITGYGNACDGGIESTTIGGVSRSSAVIKPVPSSGTINACELPQDIGSNYVYKVLSSDVCNDNSPDYEISYKIDGGYSCIVPDGMVATAKTSSSNCTGPTYVVEYLSNGIVACAVDGTQPDPNSFVVSQVDSSDSCQIGNGDDKTWTLRSPSSGVKVCLNYGKPDSWGFQSYNSNDSTCKKSGTSGTVSTPSAVLSGLSEGTAYCTKPTLPEGWVFKSIQSTVSSLCSTKKFYQVGTPSTDSSVETPICYLYDDNGPIPQGYMITANANGGTTCIEGTAVRIKTVQDGLFVCDTQNLPGDFVVSDTLSAGSTCSLYRYQITRAVGDGPYYTCSNQAVPAGFVITGVGDYIDCGSSSSYRLERPDPDGTKQVCWAQDLDSILLGTNLGLVILGYEDNNSSCTVGSGTTTAYLVGSPNRYGNTTICTTESRFIPEGYILVETGTYPACDGGLGSIIMRDVQEIMPTPYVDPEPNVGPQDLDAINYDCGSSSSSAVINGASRNSVSCP